MLLLWRFTPLNMLVQKTAALVGMLQKMLLILACLACASKKEWPKKGVIVVEFL